MADEIPRPCKGCGGPIDDKRHTLTRYCSDHCKQRADKRLKGEKRGRIPKPPKPPKPPAEPRPDDNAQRRGALRMHAIRREREAGTAEGVPTPTIAGCDLTVYRDDEWEFMRAVEAEKKNLRKRFLSWAEVLHVALKLGYRKDKPKE